MKFYVKPELDVVELFSAESMAAMPQGFEGWDGSITSYLFGSANS